MLKKFNTQPFHKLPGNHREHLERVGRPALQSRPVSPHVYAEWHKARRRIDYHAAVDGHCHLLPQTPIKKAVEVHITHNTAECFHQGQRVASHHILEQLRCHL